MADRTAVHWVDRPEQLERLGRRLAEADVISLDTEQDSFFSHRTKVCLIQVNALGEDWIIDPLALDRFDPLVGPLEDPDVITIFHAGENDIDLMRRDCGLEIRGLFDTMIAAAVIGYRKTGLAGLLDQHFDVRLDKKYQRSDWRQRPLDREQIEYAALDVRYLEELRELLLEELEQLDRVEEASSEFLRIEKVEHAERVFDPDDYFRLQGARDLDGVGRRVLRELYILRESIAAEEDRALFRVCPDHALVSLARRLPSESGQLQRIRGLSDRWRRQLADRILELVRRARDQGPLAPPPRKRPPEGTQGRLDDRQRKLYDHLRRWRAVRAEERGVEAGRVVPNALLLALVRARPDDMKGLERAGLESWRIREYGEDLLDCLTSRR